MKTSEISYLQKVLQDKENTIAALRREIERLEKNNNKLRLRVTKKREKK